MKVLQTVLQKELAETGKVPFESCLDPGIANEVLMLIRHGVETTQSCEGGAGHPFPEPTVRFDGKQYEGYRAVAVALAHGLSVNELRRVWEVIDGEIVGPQWELTFGSKERA